ncbi:trichohyalin-like isoform X1 [Gadus morhua]|uniref:trichohyalin-like isoform X1 n=1 Tax=Gadus morhua TaxID=8049 RepID=UPI0011B45BE6|nr:trichohyalin-like isoform X1 [Gadus morhua]
MSQITKLGLRGESRNLTLDSTLRDWTHVPPESPEAMPKNMQDLICEFKTLYEEKIKRLDLETSATPEEKLQMKVYALQSYVSDLTNQNQVLVEAVEDLEKEAQHKVSSVGMKLQPSDSIVHERMQQRWSLGRSACSLQPTGDTECRSAASSITPLLQPAGRVPRNPDVPEVELRLPSTAQMDGRPRGHTDPGRTVDVEAQRRAWCPGLSGWPRELDRDSPDQREIVRLEDWPGKAEGEGWRVGAEAAALQTRRRLLLAGGDPGRHAQTGQDRGLQRVRHSEPDAVPQCRDSQGSIERALYVQEKHCQQLSLDNSQLPDSLAALQNKTSAWRVGDLSRSLGQERQPVHDQLQSTKESHQVQDQLQRTNQESPQKLQVQDQLQSPNPESTNQESWQVQDQLQSTNQESQQNQQIQEQLQKANQEVGRLRQELAQLRHTAEKKIQRREVKLAALVKELEERKKLGSDCQKELPCTQSSSERLQREAARLRAKMEERGRVCAGLARDKERLERDLARGHEDRRAAHLEVRSREQLIIQLRAEMKATQQTHHRTLEEMSALQREVSRLTEDMGGRQEETCLLRGKVREQEEIAEQKEKERVQLHLQLCGSQQTGTVPGGVRPPVDL